MQIGDHRKLSRTNFKGKIRLYVTLVQVTGYRRLPPVLGCSRRPELVYGGLILVEALGGGVSACRVVGIWVRYGGSRGLVFTVMI